ncbi:MAG: alkaline phosphatase family protein [Burkholderiales bacterium]|jgi:alkaline phosphatase D|nr:alkaline phosphatase family protein [Burkholderiales bacterium]
MRLLLALLTLLLAMPSAAATGLSSGPMAGHTTMRTARVWLQADGPGRAQIELWRADEPQGKQRSAVVELRADTDFATTFELVALEPGTRYEYRILLDGDPVGVGERSFVHTQPLWRWRTDPPDLRVFLGSCAYVNVPPYDRPGTPYGSDYFIFDTIAAKARATPGHHFMLWLGDNMYFREVDYESPWGMNDRWRRHRALPALQPLLAATHHYAIWDDHDYGPNDANRSFVFKGAALQLFQRYWANPSHGLPGVPGIFTTFSHLDADFFLLDDRWYRSADRAVDDAERTLLGRAQIDWLKQALAASTATFKFIANGSQLLNDGTRYEGWHNYPQERTEFLDWLERQGVKGVVFLSGDRHHTELLRRERPGSYPLYELTCSPLTAGARTTDDEKDNPLRVPGTVIMGARNFCTLDVTGSRTERTLVFRAFTADGRELWMHPVRADTLRPPAK